MLLQTIGQLKTLFKVLKETVQGSTVQKFNGRKQKWILCECGLFGVITTE
jgi:hypothetical protein